MVTAVSSDVTEVTTSLGSILDDVEDLVVLDIMDESAGVVVGLEDVIKTSLGGSVDFLVDNLLDLVDRETLAGSAEDPLNLTDELGNFVDRLDNVLSLDVVGDPFDVSDDTFEGGDATGVVLLEGGGSAESEDESNGGLHSLIVLCF